MTKEELLNKVSKLIMEYEYDGHDNSVGCFIYFDELYEYDGEKFAALPSWELKKVPKTPVVLQNHAEDPYDYGDDDEYGKNCQPLDEGDK